MALNFPTGPTSGATYTYGGKTWQWNTYAWDVVSPNFVNTLNGATGNLSITGSANQVTVNTSASQIVVGLPNNLTVGNLTVTGNLLVSGSMTSQFSEIVLIEDNIIVLNANVTGGSPTENAGIQVSRGASAAVQMLWNETTDKWTFTNDGSQYYDLPVNVVNTVNGATGNIVSIATTGSNVFTGLNTFNAGISVTGVATFTDNVNFIGFTSGLEIVMDSPTITMGDVFGGGDQVKLIIDNGTVDIQAYGTLMQYGGGGIVTDSNLSGTTASFSGLVSSSAGFSGAGSNLTNIVKTFNGLSGAVSFAVPLASSSVTGVASFGNEFVVTSGAVGLTSNYVKSVNGLTGAVVSIATTGSNVFTGLNSFNAGLSASGATFANDIKVNGVNIGLGGGNIASNLGIGKGALSGNSGGLFNTAVGSGVMEIGTNSYSIAFGYNALNSCTGGGMNNVALGSSTMTTISSASNNVAIGTNSSQALVDGNYNVSIGGESLLQNANGSSNLAIGYQALGNNYTSNNVGIGYQALFTNDEGQQNTAIGNEALRSIATTGSAERNTAIGYQAGRWKGTGTGVVLNRLNTANDSIFIGWRARSSADAQTNQIVIGNNTLGGGSNTTTIGTTGTIDATIYGKLNLPSGLSAAGATFSGNVAMTNTSSHTGLASFAGGLSAAGATFSGNVAMTNTSSHTGLASFAGGLSAAGATFSAPISSTRMARHTSAAISAVKTSDFTPTAAEDGTIFYIEYGGKGQVIITLDGLPIGWRAKFFNVGNGAVVFETGGDMYGEGGSNGLGTWLMEAICIGSNTYFIG